MDDKMIELVSSLSDDEFNDVMESVINDPSTIKTDEMKELLAMEAVYRTGRAGEGFRDCEIRLYNEIFSEFIKGNITEEDCHELINALDKSIEERGVEPQIHGEPTDWEKFQMKRDNTKVLGDKIGKFLDSDKPLKIKQKSSSDYIKNGPEAVPGLKEKLDKKAKEEEENKREDGTSKNVKTYLADKIAAVKNTLAPKQPVHESSLALEKAMDNAIKKKLDEGWKENENSLKEINSSKKTLAKLMKQFDEIDGRDGANGDSKKELEKQIKEAHKAMKDKISAYNNKKKELEKKYEKIGAATPVKEDGKSSSAQMAGNVLKSVESDTLSDVSSIKK